MEKLPPSQYEFEFVLRGKIKHGDESKIARKQDVSPEQISQEFNPHNEKKSKLYQGFRQLCDITDVDSDAGIFLADFIRREIYKRAGKDLSCGDINELASIAAQESLDVAKAVLTGAPDDEIHKQAVEAVDANTTLAKAITGKLKAVAKYNESHMRDKTGDFLESHKELIA